VLDVDIDETSGCVMSAIEGLTIIHDRKEWSVFADG
jgi:hypothetical protein